MLLFLLCFCVIKQIASFGQKCDLCKDTNWLFVVGTGRSGSTTLLNMLNAVPHIFLAGENGGVLSYLLDAYIMQYSPPARFKKMQNEPRQGSRKLDQPGYGVGAWYHPTISVQDEFCDIQEYTRDLIGIKQVNVSEKNFKIAAFKEIRFKKQHLELMTKSVFPCAKFIMNYRLDFEEQHKSTFQRYKSVERLQEMNDILLTFAKSYPKRTFLLPLEHYTLQTFNTMLRWIGIQGCSYTAIAQSNMNHTYLHANRSLVVLDNELACQYSPRQS